jgi:hypothetical protein
MNQQLLPQPKHSTSSVVALQAICHVFIMRDIIVLIVSFTAEMLLCTIGIQTQLLYLSSAEHYLSTLVANMF